MEGGFITDETNLAASTGCDTGTIRNDDLPGGTRRNRAGPGLRVQIIRNFLARASGPWAVRSKLLKKDKHSSDFQDHGPL